MFSGTFDGDGHVVSGININKTEDYPEPYGYYLGFFGYSEGLIMNVNVADSSIIGRRYTGAVWGCSGSGSVKCTDISAGGICGYNQGGVISQCYNTGNVRGPSFDGGVITTEATKKTEGKKIYTFTICGYKKTEIIGKLEQSYPIVISGGDTASKLNAEAGEMVDVSAPFGYDIIVADAEGRQIAKIIEKGSLPASGVVITTARGEIFAYMTNAWNHSYVYSYDSDMNRIKVNSDAKRGVITIDLGAENAGRNFTIYSGRKNTSKKLTEGVFDENGKFTFSADEGRNYTLVLD